MNKQQLAGVLRLWRVTSFTCTRQSKADLMQESKRTTHTFVENEFLTRAPRGPSVEELVAELVRHKHEHPEYFRTLAEVFLRAESLQDSSDPLFHQFIFTPPYEGYFPQITDHWWAHAKNYVGLSLERHNTIALLVHIVRLF